MAHKWKNGTRTYRICLCAILTTIAYLVTYFFPIPLPNGAGYLNIGDSVILFSAIFIDPMCGLIVGALSGALADFSFGYMLYIPFTIVAKGCEALIAGSIFKIKKPRWIKFLGLYLGGLMMATVYIIPDLLIVDSFALALANYIMNIGQGIFGATLAICLYLVISKSKKIQTN